MLLGLGQDWQQEQQLWLCCTQVEHCAHAQYIACMHHEQFMGCSQEAGGKEMRFSHPASQPRHAAATTRDTKDSNEGQDVFQVSQLAQDNAAAGAQ